MQLDHYRFEVEGRNTVFEFSSIGPKGVIDKIVIFQKMQFYELYNLAFGDKEPVTGELNDLIISNNGDTQKVLATVIAILFLFFDHYPDAIVTASGSTEARTRLYQIGISKFHHRIPAYFEIFGETANALEPFRIGRRYSSFLIRRKIL